MGIEEVRAKHTRLQPMGATMRDTILEILKEIRPDVDFENETLLIDDGILTSLDIVAIVSDLNDEFDVDISPDDLLPENFNSVDAMVELVSEQ